MNTRLRCCSTAGLVLLGAMTLATHAPAQLLSTPPNAVPQLVWPADARAVQQFQFRGNRVIPIKQGPPLPAQLPWATPRPNVDLFDHRPFTPVLPDFLK